MTVDTDKLEQFDLSIEDVRRALASQNLELPGGRVDQGDRELVLRVLGRYDTAERFNDLVDRDPRRLPDPHPRRRPRRGVGRGPADAWPGSTASPPSA